MTADEEGAAAQRPPAGGVITMQHRRELPETRAREPGGKMRSKNSQRRRYVLFFNVQQASNYPEQHLDLTNSKKKKNPLSFFCLRKENTTKMSESQVTSEFLKLFSYLLSPPQSCVHGENRGFRWAWVCSQPCQPLQNNST